MFGAAPAASPALWVRHQELSCSRGSQVRGYLLVPADPLQVQHFPHTCTGVICSCN